MKTKRAKDRTVYSDKAGKLLNPDWKINCGALDTAAILPEPIHQGGCKGCAKAIHALLKARDKRPAPPPAWPAVQRVGAWMDDAGEDDKASPSPATTKTPSVRSSGS